jgi:glucosamine-6-phosphate deaminase
MGGTFQRLVDQGHEVHTAYQTTGNIAVFDDDVMRFADFVADINQMESSSSSSNDNGSNDSLYHRVVQAIRKKEPGDIDTEEVLWIKGLIRKSEARAASRYVGISDDHTHFLNLPFYETGTVKKSPPSQVDVEIVMDLIRQVQPHQIYAAGDLSDPHGTHRVCYQIIVDAIGRLKSEQETLMKDCWVWLYRGAWQEYPMDEIDMAVPLSPEEVQKKRKAIFKHQSQKDDALFPGNDSRQFWERAEDRNSTTARIYDELGLPEYEAMEAFKRFHY